MPRIVFTPQLRCFTSAPEVQSSATTLAAALKDAFGYQLQLRGDGLDDQGHRRANVVMFIDGQRNSDRTTLGDALAPDSTVQVLQALSGG